MTHSVARSEATAGSGPRLWPWLTQSLLPQPWPPSSSVKELRRASNERRFGRERRASSATKANLLSLPSLTLMPAHFLSASQRPTARSSNPSPRCRRQGAARNNSSLRPSASQRREQSKGRDEGQRSCKGQRQSTRFRAVCPAAAAAAVAAAGQQRSRRSSAEGLPRPVLSLNPFFTSSRSSFPVAWSLASLLLLRSCTLIQSFASAEAPSFPLTSFSCDAPDARVSKLPVAGCQQRRGAGGEHEGRRGKESRHRHKHTHKHMQPATRTASASAAAATARLVPL